MMTFCLSGDSDRGPAVSQSLLCEGPEVGGEVCGLVEVPLALGAGLVGGGGGGLGPLDGGLV